MNAFEEYLNASRIEKNHRELIRIRASQINGCAFCVDMHTHDALQLGEPLQKILLVSAWREAYDTFTEQERVLLQMTEEITLIHQHGLTDDTYSKSIQLFGEEITAQIIMTVITINAWNRIGVATHLQPPLRK
jgi:AhpD family alkylhydroperoxidase